jgi:transcriptional regulatory protein LevR
MDVFTFRQLKESKYYDPILTEVMFDYDMMLEMVFHSMTIIEKGYDTVWDANMFNFTRMYFQEGMEYIEKLITDKGMRIRLIVETTLENIEP